MNSTFGLGDGLDGSAARTAVADKMNNDSKQTHMRRNRIALIDWRRCCPPTRVMSSLRPLKQRPDLSTDQRQEY